MVQEATRDFHNSAAIVVRKSNPRIKKNHAKNFYFCDREESHESSGLGRSGEDYGKRRT